jgi:hypothetical protein
MIKKLIKVIINLNNSWQLKNNALKDLKFDFKIILLKRSYDYENHSRY